MKYGAEKMPVNNSAPVNKHLQQNGPSSSRSGANPADLGMLIDALEYKHGPDTATVSRQQVNGGRPSSAGPGVDRNCGVYFCGDLNYFASTVLLNGMVKGFDVLCLLTGTSC